MGCRSSHRTTLRAGVMPSVADLIPIVHRVVLATFVGATSIFMLVGVLRRVRLRRPLVVWQRSGRFGRLPMGPVLFLLCVAGGVAYLWWSGRSVPLVVLLGYLAGGLFWFVAVWMRRTVVITEYGIVPGLGRVDRAVVWSQVVDYFATNREGRPHFVFFYRGREGRRRRLDLPVPQAVAGEVRTVVERKVGACALTSDEIMPDEEDLRRLDDRIDFS